MRVEGCLLGRLAETRGLRVSAGQRSSACVLRQTTSELQELHPSVAAGKMVCLEALMAAVLEGVRDRMVVVSSSVMALNLIQELCQAHAWSTVRIDGSTAAEHRQDIVTGFNSRHSSSQVGPGARAERRLSRQKGAASWQPSQLCDAEFDSWGLTRW